MHLLRWAAVVALVIGVGALVLDDVRVARGEGEMRALRDAVGAKGGGVIFVRNAEDCGATAGPVDHMAASLARSGLAVRGVVLRRGPVEGAVERASRSFPHMAVSPWATTPLVVLGYDRTPFALAVDRGGRIVSVEDLAGRSVTRVVESLKASLAGR